MEKLSLEVAGLRADLQARGKVFLAALVMLVFLAFCIVNPGKMIEFGLFIAVFFVLCVYFMHREEMLRRETALRGHR